MNMDTFPGGWIANLSNGLNVFESEGVPGEISSWQKLLKRCRDESVKITMLRLQYGPINIMAMPQQMCDGYFQAREVHKVVYRGTTIRRHGVGSVVGDQVFITWVEFTKDGLVLIRNDVRPLSTCKIHTTIMEAENGGQINYSATGGDAPVA